MNTATLTLTKPKSAPLVVNQKCAPQIQISALITDIALLSINRARPDAHKTLISAPYQSKLRPYV